MARFSVCFRDQAQGVRSTVRHLAIDPVQVELMDVLVVKNNEIKTSSTASFQLSSSQPSRCATSVPQEISQYSQSFETMSHLRLALRPARGGFTPMVCRPQRDRRSTKSRTPLARACILLSQNVTAWNCTTPILKSPKASV
ncbi:unnamed protein product [Cercospora beticola]|nr:unnamed protein product [Cercospora beticola]